MYQLIQDFNKPNVTNQTLELSGKDLVELSSYTRLVSSTPETQFVDDDAVMFSSSFSTTEDAYNFYSPIEFGPNSLTIENPAICEISNNEITRLQDGSTRLVSEYGIFKVFYDLNFLRVTGQTDPSFSFWNTGTLAKEIADNVNVSISGKLAADAGMFSVKNHSSLNFIRNLSNILSGYDLTWLSVHNSEGGNKQIQSLISPRHTISVMHANYDLETGSKVYFLTSNNQLIERMVIGKVRPPSMVNSTFPDIAIHTLDSDLPVSITPVKIVPLSLKDRLSKYEQGRLPIFRTNQSGEIVITELSTITSTESTQQIVGLRYPKEASWQAFYKTAISGDSGNPIFCLINGECVLLSCLTWGPVGGGTNFSEFLSTINQMIVEADTAGGVSTGYTLTEVDLSAFPTYN